MSWSDQTRWRRSMSAIKKTIKYTAALVRVTMGLSAVALVVLRMLKKPQ